MKRESNTPATHGRAEQLFAACSKEFPPIIKVQEVAEQTGLSDARLCLLRVYSGGRRSMGFGRSVRYRLAEVINWMKRADFGGTSEEDPGISIAAKSEFFNPDAEPCRSAFSF